MGSLWIVLLQREMAFLSRCCGPYQAQGATVLDFYASAWKPILFHKNLIKKKKEKERKIGGKAGLKNTGVPSVRMRTEVHSKQVHHISLENRTNKETTIHWKGIILGPAIEGAYFKV